MNLMDKELVHKYWNSWTNNFKDAAYCIYTTERNWNPRDFYMKGKEDWDKYFEPLMKDLPDRESVMEIGVGICRVLFWANFDRAYGIDVSSGMLKIAEQMKEEMRPSKYFKFGPPETLDFISNNSITFIYSIICFQHIPDKEAQVWYVRQIDRVLKPGGLAKIMVQSPAYTDKNHSPDCSIGYGLSTEDISSNLIRSKIINIEPSGWVVQPDRNNFYTIRKDIE